MGDDNLLLIRQYSNVKRNTRRCFHYMVRSVGNLILYAYYTIHAGCTCAGITDHTFTHAQGVK